jgi:hypothetical protein
MNINQILEQICKGGSIYDEIINNLIQPRFDLKPQLISEVAISYLENATKIEDIYEKGYFQYYFIRTVKNQIHSSTSPFRKAVTIKDNEFIDNFDFADEDNEIQNKIDREEKINLIEDSFKDIKKTWYKERIWNEYFYNKMSYRDIQKKYSISYTYAWLLVDEMKQEIKNKINENGKNNKN